MLELQNISYGVEQDGDSKNILRDISLTIDERFVAITGPNGGGKSTLAKVIAGILTPTQGRILLDGEDITGLDITQRAQKGIDLKRALGQMDHGLPQPGTAGHAPQAKEDGDHGGSDQCARKMAETAEAGRTGHCRLGRRLLRRRGPAFLAGALLQEPLEGCLRVQFQAQGLLLLQDVQIEADQLRVTALINWGWNGPVFGCSFYSGTPAAAGGSTPRPRRVRISCGPSRNCGSA